VHRAGESVEEARLDDVVIDTQNNKAVQVLAAEASGIEDCLELLAMLDLEVGDLSPRLLTG
jgi:hypothetical protein